MGKKLKLLIQTYIEKIYVLLTKNKTITIFVIILSIVSGLYSFWPKSVTPKQQINDSPGSINTVNQSGGSNIINNLSPKPTLLREDPISLNIPYQGYYQQTVSLMIGSPYQGMIIKEADSKQLIFKYISEKAEDDSGQIVGGPTFQRYTISFLTYKEIKLSDIEFSLQ